MNLEFTPQGVLQAYANGIFPMYHAEEDMLGWYQPDPRTIIPLDGFHISRSLAKTIRKGTYEVRIDTDFEGVMRGCADRETGTWISEEFITLYSILHRAGYAHSVETWRADRLVGGTYGISIGAAFMAESKFHRETDASKVALAALVDILNRSRFELLDVQYLTPHLASLGAIEIPHSEYASRLRKAINRTRTFNATA